MILRTLLLGAIALALSACVNPNFMFGKNGDMTRHQAVQTADLMRTF